MWDTYFDKELYYVSGHAADENAAVMELLYVNLSLYHYYIKDQSFTWVCSCSFTNLKYI